MKRLFLVSMITLTMVIVSCTNGKTEVTPQSTDTTSVDSTLVDTVIIN
jgi:hypothetical protein